MNIITLTKEQIKRILHETLKPKNRYNLGAGSARMVFVLPDYICKELNIEGEAVLKLNIGLAGYNQSQLETLTFERYGDNFLARIYYKCNFFIIMEKVHEIDENTRDILEMYIDSYEEGTDMCLDDIELSENNDYIQIVDRLASIFNSYSLDFAQLGHASDGRIVAYDYGFQPDSDSKQCSSGLLDYQKITDFIYENNITSVWLLEYYLENFFEYLESDSHTNPSWYVNNELGLYTEYQARQCYGSPTVFISAYKEKILDKIMN